MDVAPVAEVDLVSSRLDLKTDLKYSPPGSESELAELDTECDDFLSCASTASVGSVVHSADQADDQRALQSPVVFEPVASSSRISAGRTVEPTGGDKLQRREPALPEWDLPLSQEQASRLSMGAHSISLQNPVPVPTDCGVAAAEDNGDGTPSLAVPVPLRSTNKHMFQAIDNYLEACMRDTTRDLSASTAHYGGMPSSPETDFYGSPLTSTQPSSPNSSRLQSCSASADLEIHSPQLASKYSTASLAQPSAYLPPTQPLPRMPNSLASDSSESELTSVCPPWRGSGFSPIQKTPGCLSDSTCHGGSLTTQGLSTFTQPTDGASTFELFPPAFSPVKSRGVSQAFLAPTTSAVGAPAFCVFPGAGLTTRTGTSSHQTFSSTPFPGNISSLLSNRTSDVPRPRSLTPIATSNFTHPTNSVDADAVDVTSNPPMLLPSLPSEDSDIILLSPGRLSNSSRRGTPSNSCQVVWVDLTSNTAAASSASAAVPASPPVVALDDSTTTLDAGDCVEQHTAPIAVDDDVIEVKEETRSFRPTTKRSRPARSSQHNLVTLDDGESENSEDDLPVMEFCPAPGNTFQLNSLVPPKKRVTRSSSRQAPRPSTPISEHSSVLVVESPGDQPSLREPQMGQPSLFSGFYTPLFDSTSRHSPVSSSYFQDISESPYVSLSADPLHLPVSSPTMAPSSFLPSSSPSFSPVQPGSYLGNVGTDHSDMYPRASSYSSGGQPGLSLLRRQPMHPAPSASDISIGPGAGSLLMPHGSSSLASRGRSLYSPAATVPLSHAPLLPSADLSGGGDAVYAPLLSQPRRAQSVTGQTWQHERPTSFSLENATTFASSAARAALHSSVAMPVPVMPSAPMQVPMSHPAADTHQPATAGSKAIAIDVDKEKNDAEPDDSPTCPICLETLSDVKKSGASIVATTCGHIFCEQCILDTLKAFPNKCPNCRKKLTKKKYQKIYF